jgi:hypothetical protein
MDDDIYGFINTMIALGFLFGIVAAVVNKA